MTSSQPCKLQQAEHERALADVTRTIAAEVERHTTDALVDTQHSLQLAVNSIAQLSLAMAESSRDLTEDVSAESATALLDSFRVDLDAILGQLGFSSLDTDGRRHLRSASAPRAQAGLHVGSGSGQGDHPGDPRRLPLRRDRADPAVRRRRGQPPPTLTITSSTHRRIDSRPRKKTNMPHYFGIDLGTTNSAIAYLDDNGQPAVVPNTVTGHPTTPSVVYFQEPTEVAVGDIARNAAIAEPEYVVSLVKRSMGEARTFTMHGIDHTPESISALILRHLFEDAKQAIGSDDNSVVITVPAYFGMRETQATVEAGTLAGLNVVSTIPEPIAAALHYGCAPGDSVETLLVFDLGGGTFDTSVLRIGAKSIDTVVVDGDRKLGGADWDLRIAQWLTEQFVEQSGCDPAEMADPGFQQLVLQQAEAAKIQLSQVPSTKVPIRFGAKAVTMVLTREKYEELTADLLDRTIEVVRRTLATAESQIGRQRRTSRMSCWSAAPP